jgi:hypothetical protein
LVDVPFPILAATGRHPQAAGGNLVNCYAEKLPPTAGKPYAYPRVPGLKQFTAVAGVTPFRGGLLVGNTLYVAVNNKVYAVTSAGVVTTLSGTTPGTTAPLFMARDNAANPNIVIVSPGDGAAIINAGASAVQAYPDSNVGQPNAVVFLKGLFFFTYGNAQSKATNVNTTTINTLAFANAESKPDTLYCPVPLGNGQLLLCGSNSMEVWGGSNDTGFPFNYVATINRGVIGPNAISGWQDSFGRGLYFVSDDFRVYTLSGYTPTLVSSDEVNRMIESDPNQQAITVNCYIVNGHGFVAIKGTTWCWEYETDLGSWHIRRSYLQQYWRGALPVNAFGMWLCGDVESGNLLRLDPTAQDETGNPLRMRIETGPQGAFPAKLRVNQIELYCTKGVGIATGSDPTQTDPDVEISMSRDAGVTWSNARRVKVGRQANGGMHARSSIWGQATGQGVRWRFDQSSNVPFAFMGADMQFDQLR